MLLSTPDAFLNEEERCGHLVKAEAKRLWSIQLGCLQELRRICETHNIPYFASGGTLLGAVRHKGYIPWDDDIDVMMYFNDYSKFCKIAPNEIKNPYFFQSYQTEHGFGPAMSRIRNSETTGCTSYDYSFADGHYNCGIFIDIFPLFGIENRKLPLLFQKSKMSFWRAAITGYETKRKACLVGWSLKKLFSPYLWWWMVVSLFTNHEGASRHFLNACASAKSYNQVALLSFSGFNPKLTWNKEWFDELILMPFEFTEIPCPKAYDPILRTQYGDYMIFVKGGQIHTMVLFDTNTSFKQKFKDSK